MPLLDHFRSPLGDIWPWEGVHSAWAAQIAAHLNQSLLPADYYAVPLTKRGGQVEIDVAAFQSDELSGLAGDAGGTATIVWAPPRPVATASVDFLDLDLFEVQVIQRQGGPQLRAAIELVSPSNKGRPSHRQALAIKCASYLQRGVCVVVVDVVTERTVNLHAELVQLLSLPGDFHWQAPAKLYAATYRSIASGEEQLIQYWPEPLALGAMLPTMPLWLDTDLCIPLNFEESYVATCESLRIRL